MKTRQSTERAILTHLNTAEEFAEALRRELGTLQLLIERTLFFSGPIAVPSGTEAAERFAEELQADPRHLILHAFNNRVEYAWLGAIGLRAELTLEGDLEVEKTDYYTEKQEAKEDNGARVHVQLLKRGGRTIYEKLVRLGPR